MSTLCSKCKLLGAFCLAIVFIIFSMCPIFAGEKPEEEVVTIRHIHQWWREPELEVMRKVWKDFELQNPNIRLEITQVPWSDAYREITTALAGGEMPDVIILGMTWHAELMEIGALEPLNDYITPKMREDFFLLDFYTIDGKLTGIPVTTGPWGMIYRRDMFEEAGLDPDLPPKTWDELVEYAKKLKKYTGAWAIGTYCIQPKLIWNWVPVMYTAGCPLLAKEGGKWKSVINTHEGLSGMHAFIDLITVHKVMPKDVVGEGYSETLEGFKQGKYPILGPHMLSIGPELTKWDPGRTKWAFMQVPVIKERVALASNTAYAMSSTSKHKKEAWKFIEFITTPQVILDVNIAAAQPPTRKSLMDHPMAQDYPVQAQIQVAQYATGHPVCRAFTEIMDKIYAPIVQEAMLGKISVEEAAKLMDEEASKILEKY